jgi:hypothetical protein
MDYRPGAQGFGPWVHGSLKEPDQHGPLHPRWMHEIKT